MPVVTSTGRQKSPEPTLHIRWSDTGAGRPCAAPPRACHGFVPAPVPSLPSQSFDPAGLPSATGAGAGAGAGVGVAAAPPAPVDPALQRFRDFCVDREIRPDVADDLYGVLTTSKVVLVLDDRCGGRVAGAGGSLVVGICTASTFSTVPRKRREGSRPWRRPSTYTYVAVPVILMSLGRFAWVFECPCACVPVCGTPRVRAGPLLCAFGCAVGAWVRKSLTPTLGRCQERPRSRDGVNWSDWRR